MFTETYWTDWVKSECQNYLLRGGKKVYLKKGYLHFDHRIWFPALQGKIEEILKNELKIYNLTKKRHEYHSFSPFIKLLLKTPRYRYQFEEGHYGLETKIRPICFASHIDSLIMGYYSFALTRVYERFIKDNDFDDVVLAYRSDLGKCNIQFAKEVVDAVKSRKVCSVIALDIKGYFDHIDHAILKEKWSKVIGSKELPEDQYRLYKILTKYSYVNQKTLLRKYAGARTRGREEGVLTLMDFVPGNTISEKYSTLKSDQLIVSNELPNSKTKRFCGIPQGSPISALLSNIYLIDFDRELKVMGDNEGFVYRRYCDDILLICNSDKATELIEVVIDKISNEYYLTIQPAKVDIVDFRPNSKGVIRSFGRQRKMSAKGELFCKTPVVTDVNNENRFYKPLQYLGFEYNGKSVTIRSSSLSRFFIKLNSRLMRTVGMAYSPNAVTSKIFVRQLYQRYSHLGKRNFLTYAYNASKERYKSSNGMMQGFGSSAIRKQVSMHFVLLKAELSRKNLKWYNYKTKGSKAVVFKATLKKISD